MRIAIVGAGIAGLAAAFELVQAGHRVTIYEAAAESGGLASGFRDARWNWPLERFYHHIFETDSAIQTLAQRIGCSNRIFFRSPVTAQWWNGRLYPIDGPRRLLQFPAMPLPDRIRLGLAIAYLKYGTKNWHALEQVTAEQWATRWMGSRAYQTMMKPLLVGKFGPYAADVNMAWLWARFRARSFRLGYFVGGFQAFADALHARVEQEGGTVYLQRPVQRLETNIDGSSTWTLRSGDEQIEYDAVIATGSPQLLLRMVPQLPPDYVSGVMQMRSMGAVVLTVALRQPLTPGFYWMQGMPRQIFPFLALVEHTNFIEPYHYGNDHLIYCGDYLLPDHEYFSLSADELLQRVIDALPHFHPQFHPEWIRDRWLHRAPYAQPVVTVNQSQSLPSLATPLRGLYWASMSHVYPWDRGTNFAVTLGQEVAQLAMNQTG